MRHHLILLAAAAMLVGACGDDDPIAPPPSPTLAVTVSAISNLRPGDEVEISISAENFVLDATKMGQANEVGVGHYRVYWDDATGADFLAAGSDDLVTVKVPDDAADGSHYFRVTLMNNDRSPVSPAQGLTVNVTVMAAKITLTIDETEDLLPGSPIVLTISVQNFTLDGTKLGQPAQQGVGHYHVYWGDASGLDDLVASAARQVTIYVPADTALGLHTLRVALCNNDHTPLSQPVEVRRNLTVKAGPRLRVTVDPVSALTPGALIYLTVNTTNFVLMSSMIGEPPLLDTGHYHVYWDDEVGDDFMLESADNASYVVVPADATDGEHSLRVELVNNDHTPLTPAVMVRTKLTVGY